MSILLGNGDGTFQPPQNFMAGRQPGFVGIGDFNGDAIQDLVVANTVSNDVSILLGNGDGTFRSPQNFGVGSHPLSVGVGDFDGDEMPDLAVANSNSARVAVLINITRGL